ncbi:MAG: RIP metalloprotease RseP [Sterolibacteriaceae bacterium]|nr:RIP metalloprotease RseP [Sterolibacteriaceae bacterium]MBK9085253.1 RIP metalloprotease RseP [Sterolibacteriaceae bacterium]
MNMVSTVAAFVFALGILIVVHEYGHYLIARWCGVKVLRFSVGFGKALITRRRGPDNTEWTLAAFPLGGYVKMLDEREAPVEPHELHRAFNRQPVGKRFAIVLAGPVANFLLAIALYWGLYSYGTQELRPLLGKPVAQSVAERAGFADGELVTAVAGQKTETWQELRWQLLQHALDKAPVKIEVVNARNELSERSLDLSDVSTENLEGDLLSQLGLRLFRPDLPAIIGKLSADGVAERAGLVVGDRLTVVDGKPIEHWMDVVTAIRAAADKEIEIEFRRADETRSARLTPTEVEENGRRIGRIGIGPQETDFDRSRLMTTVSYSLIDALSKAVHTTWETSTFSLSILGRMVTGDVSWKNLSGPVTIADYAGQSARLGLTYYLKFLALISISLGVLNLLPIPILDGGHLMYYIVEIIKGGPVSEKVMEIGQQIGLALLVMLMAFAFYNDINRLLSG